MSKATLLALADRCIAVEHMPDDGGYQLDGDIARLFGWKYAMREETHSWGWIAPNSNGGFNAMPPRYSTSVDAAMKLVPDIAEEWNVEGWNSTGYQGARATAWVQGAARVYASTPALALAAAALRARAAMEEA